MNSENNGGKTSYYDLPLPDRDKINSYLIAVKQENMSIDFAVDQILNLCPQTLNDLIEYKEMKPWQHEVMKATYALYERAKKNPKKGSSVVREINKILYYANRGLNLTLSSHKSPSP